MPGERAVANSYTPMVQEAVVSLPLNFITVEGFFPGTRVWRGGVGGSGQAGQVCAYDFCHQARLHPTSLQRAVLLGAAAAGGAAAYYYTADIDTQMEMASATGPLVRMLDPELSHIIGIQVRSFAGDLQPSPASL